MPLLPLRASLLLGLALAAGAVRADPAEDCRNVSVAPAARIAACDVAVEAAADPLEQAELLVRRAEARRLQADYDAVLADLAAAERLAPGADPQLRADILVQRSEVFRHRDDLDSALADIEEAERLAPADADPLANRALVLHDQGDHEGAMAQLVRALQLEPEHPRALLLSMYVLYAAGDFEACLKYGSKAVEIAPARPQTWLYRGNCLTGLGRVEEAIADYETAAAIGLPNAPDEAVLQDNLSMSYLGAGRAEEALAAARRAVELDPVSESARMSLVSALVETGAVEEAIAAYREGQAAGVEDTMGQANNLAWGLYLAGYYQEALPIMEEWLAAHPRPMGDQFYELDTLAHLLAAVGRSYEAAQTFQRAIEVGGPELRAHYEARLTELGFPPDPAAGGLEAALQACAATGAGCAISP